jgi:hypothetical protein
MGHSSGCLEIGLTLDFGWEIGENRRLDFIREKAGFKELAV